MVDITITLAFIGEAEIWCAYACLVPFFGEGRFEDALSVERVGSDAEESVDNRTARDAEVVAEVTVCLVALAVVETDLSEVAGRLS